MPRIAYTPADLDEPADLVDAIRARRGGKLLNLDRMLLHSPAFARGWNGFLGAVRNDLDLDPLLRELAICAVALLNHAPYEFAHHAPEFLAAGGTAEQLSALAHVPQAVDDAALFSPAQRVTLAIAYEMTRRVKVNEAYFAAARAAMPPQQVVELVGVIATYNMVSRFLVALGIDLEAPAQPQDAAALAACITLDDLAALPPRGHA
jgi:Uncharacterized conserved protein